MHQSELAHKVMLNSTAPTNPPSMQREPAGIIRPPVFELLKEGLYPLTFDRARRCQNESADAAHINCPTV